MMCAGMRPLNCAQSSQREVLGSLGVVVFLRSIFSTIVFLLLRDRRIWIFVLVRGLLGLEITLVLVFAPTLSLVRLHLPGDRAAVPRGVNGETQYARRLGVRRVDIPGPWRNLPRLGEKVVSWSSGSDKEFTFCYMSCRGWHVVYSSVALNASLNRFVRYSDMETGPFLSSTPSLMKPPLTITKPHGLQRDITSSR